MIPRNTQKSYPYLKAGRLADVTAALQVLAVHESSENRISDWAFEMSRDKSANSIEKWNSIFEEHPEFFIVYTVGNDRKAALRWRYTNRAVDRATNRELPLSEKQALSPDARARLTTKPLSSEAINILLQTAISMRKESAQEVANNKWWIPLATGALSFFGALIAVLLSKHS